MNPPPKATPKAAPKAKTPKLEPPKPAPRKRWKTVLKWGVLLSLLGLVIGVSTVGIYFFLKSRDPALLDGDALVKKLTEHEKQVTTILDSNDNRIGEIYSERRTYMPIDKIPQIVQDAFVAAEDNKFWEHSGVDYTGILRAAIANLRSGRKKEGASTITQQVVKNLLLSSDKAFERKVKEIILARRVERLFTKKQILEIYLNKIYFGGASSRWNVYGVEEAARFYFGKGIADVNVGEAAMLAGLPKSPEGISPKNEKNKSRAKERQEYVLGRLVAMGKITKDEGDKWAKEPIHVVKDPFPEMNSAPEWIDPVRDVLAEKEGAENLDTLGAKVRTTLDPTLQANAQRALQLGLRAYDKRHNIGRPIRTIKDDKIDDAIAKLAKRVKGLPQAKEAYEAVVTGVFDDDKELVVDLGGYEGAVPLGTSDDARYNPDDKKPSERFKRGDVVSVILAGPAPKPPKVDTTANGKLKKKKPANEDDDDAVDIEGEPEAPTPIVEKPMKHAKHRLSFAPGPEGAVVMIETKTRKVRAIVGGYVSKVGGFDRALQAHRQAGSSFKPFVYGAAIDSGKYTAASKVNDAPEVFDLWRPKNFETTFEGPVLLRKALAKSINTVAIRVAYDMTPAVVADFAHKLGIKSELPKEMSLALGSGEVTPFEMVNAYATYAAGGQYMDARFVEAIDGKVLPADKPVQVIRPEVAYVVTNMMQSVVQEGTGAAVRALDIPVAGKTGTSNDARDTWFIGVTPDYAVGVWVGFDDDRPMGSREQGGVTAAPVFVETLKPMKLQKKAFVKPAKVVEVQIDKATGLLAPEDAPKGSSYSEVFVEGTAPTEVAPKAGETTEDTAVTSEYND